MGNVIEGELTHDELASKNDCEGSVRVVLSEALTIYEAEECHQVWLRTLSTHNMNAIFVDANQLVEIDGAGFQLLFWLKLNCDQRAISFSIEMSDELEDMLSRLHLKASLIPQELDYRTESSSVGH